jgi:hypothetical protein
LNPFVLRSIFKNSVDIFNQSDECRTNANATNPTPNGAGATAAIEAGKRTSEREKRRKVQWGKVARRFPGSEDVVRQKRNERNAKGTKKRWG